MTLMDYYTPTPHRHHKTLTSREDRLRHVNIDYNHVDHAPDLTGLRHRAFLPGAGTTISPDVVFLLKSPSHLDTRAGTTRQGIQYRLIEDLCHHAGITDYYVTYLLKYEMHGDRDPRPLETQIALAYVREELSILDPAVIVLPGERIHQLMFPEAEYEPWAHRVINGRRGTYYSLPDLLPARRSTNAYADMQDEFTHMADIITALL